MTLKRRKEDREREKDAKMEQLRKKLKTDDEGYINIYLIKLSLIIYSIDILRNRKI